MGRDLTFAFLAVAVCALVYAMFDLAAQRWHWRIGRWGRLYLLRTGGCCYICRTDWRWAEPHDIPIRSEGGYCIFPTCGKCWSEADETRRLAACEQLLRSWQIEGRYNGPGGGDRWDDDRTAIYMAVKAGL